MSDLSKQYERWWLDTGDDIHERVCSVANRLKKANAERIDAYADWIALYMDREPNDPEILPTRRDRRSRSPLIQNAVDTLHARHSRSRILPRVGSLGGNWEEQRRARGLTGYLEGDWNRLKAHDKMSTVIHDGLVLGSSAIKTYDKDGLPCMEITRCDGLLTEPMEDRNRDIRTLYQVRHVDKEVAIDTYGHEAEIMLAAGPDTAGYPAEETALDSISTDIVEIIEAWRLPSSHKRQHGRHVIVVSNCTIVNVEWERLHLPFAFFHAFRNPASWWGIGLPERMAGAQNHANEIAAKIVECFDLAAPRIISDASIEVAEEQLTDEPYRHLKVNGDPNRLVISTPPAINPQWLQYEEMIRSRAYEDVGVSQAHAQAQGDPRVQSGKGRLVQEEIDSSRQHALGRSVENLATDLAERHIGTMEAIEDKKQLKAYVRRGDAMEAISYSDVRMDTSQIHLSVFPASQLSRTLSGKLDEISGLKEIGFIQDVGELGEALEMPDIDRINRRHLARKSLADKLLDKALGGEAQAASVAMDLDYAVQEYPSLIALAEIEGAPEKGLEHARNLLAHAQKMVRDRQPPAPPVPPPGPGPAQPQQGAAMPPGGPPMAPPGMPAGMPPGIT